MFNRLFDMAARPSFTNIPEPQPDQTMKSLAALAGIRNGICGRKKMANVLFGLQHARDVDSDFHYGSDKLFRLLDGAGYSSCEAFHDHHGSIAFFRPFANASIYERARQKIISNSSHGIASLLGISKMSPFAKEHRYCRSCALRDFESLGYAYPRRTHQIMAIDRCPTHGTLLGVLPKEHRGVVEIWGLLVFDSSSTSLDDLILDDVARLPGGTEIARLCVWVDAVYRGDLGPSPTGARQQAIKAKLSKRDGASGSSAAAIEQLVRQTYSSEYLQHIGLPLREGPTAHWPAQLIGSKLFSDHTAGTLLVLAALFDSPSEFAKEVGKIAAAGNPVGPATALAPGIPRAPMTLSFIKDILGMSRLRDVAAKHGVHEDTVTTRLKQNPSLRERREKHLRGIERRKKRNVFATAFSDKPSLTISKFKVSHWTEYRWLMLNDRAWVLDFLAARGKGAMRTEDLIARVRASGEDERTEIILRRSVEAWIADSMPRRVTKKRLLEAIPGTIGRQLSTGAYPKTSRALSELTETSEQYLSRIIDRLAWLASRGNVAAAKTWAAAVIGQFSHRGSVVAKVVDMLLIQAKRSTTPTACRPGNHCEEAEEATQA